MSLVRPLLAGLFILVGGLLAGCGGAGAMRTAASAEEAHQRGVAAMQAGRHDRAAEHFRNALDFGRATDVAREAQLALARAYMADGQYLLAGQEYTRFIEFYRDDPRVEEAEYERLTSYSRLSPGYQLDQRDTRTAIEYITSYLQRYPNSARAPQAAALLDELREKLARKQYESARLYERRDLFEAAVLAYRAVLAEYPASQWADDALVGALRAQTRFAEESVPSRQGARFGEALAIYERIRELFPSSPLLAEAETYRARAEAGRRAADGRVSG